MKKILFFFLLIFSFILVKPTKAQEGNVKLYFFWSNTCPHCHQEKEFLANLQQKYGRLEVLDFEVSSDRENLLLLKKVGQQLGIEVGGVPFTVIGEHHFIGYLDEQTTGQQIEEAVQCALKDGCRDLLEAIISGQENDRLGPVPIPESLNLPIIGQIKTKNMSLPVFTLVLGLLDGFNPCAMWVLMLLISLLLGMEDRRRMWLLGGVFIFASGIVYYLFMAAWLNLFLFLGFIFWVRIAIGLVALAAGGFNLKEFWVNKEGVCKVTDSQKKQKIFDRMRAITQKQQLLLALVGLIGLAFAVNLIELVCSAGLPAIYTQVLALSHLPTWQYYLYLTLYILLFMLDDLIVFVVAMKTLRAVGGSSKYSRFSKLIGGLIMLLIGILLIFKPEWLTFA